LKVYQSLEAFQAPEWPVVTIGTFDGVHMGHRMIIEQLVDLARKRGGQSVVLTFHPHPRMVLQKELNVKLINSLEERLNLLEQVGVDHCIVHPFSLEFSRMKARDYIREILVSKLNVRSLVIGYDHHFGRNREGDFRVLEEYGSIYEFELAEIPPQVLGDVKVSSTKIRNALLIGNVQLANQYLQSHFMLSGEVVPGDQLGRTIGFPTANLKLRSPNKLIPANGVYAVRVQFEGNWHIGMMNIGVRPTVKGDQRSLEVHLLDFEGDLYGKFLRIELHKRIRDEIKFENVEQLKERIIQDRDETVAFFGA
jgi:riboflavin kinase/FMN adenylyltransferase